MIKRTILVLFFLVLILLGVLLVNTFRFTSQQVVVDPVPVINVDRDAAALRLAKAITFPTVSHQDQTQVETEAFEGLHRFLEESYPNVHATLKKEIIGGYSLLYTWQGSDASLEPIVLLAHQDVVPVAPGTEADWDFPPFDGVIEGGFIWGLGALDRKLSITSILDAVEMHLAAGAQPKRTVYLAFGHDEEIGGANGAVKIAELLKSRGVRAFFVLDEGMAIVDNVLPGIDQPLGLIGIAEKGYVSIELVVEAEGGHSSQPPRETAIGILSNAVARVEDHPMPGGIAGPARDMFMTLGPEMPFAMRAILANLWLTAPLVERQLGASPSVNALLRTTTAPTVFEAGVKDNVLPAKARAVINFRILPGDTIDSVVQHVKKVVNDDRVVIAIIDTPREPSKVSPADSDAFRTIGTTIREILPEAIVAPALVLGGTDSRNFEIITENVLRFAPERLDSTDLVRIHGTDERIGVDDYARMIRFYHRLIENAVSSPRFLVQFL